MRITLIIFSAFITLTTSPMEKKYSSSYTVEQFRTATTVSFYRQEIPETHRRKGQRKALFPKKKLGSFSYHPDGQTCVLTDISYGKQCTLLTMLKLAEGIIRKQNKFHNIKFLTTIGLQIPPSPFNEKNKEFKRFEKDFFTQIDILKKTGILRETIFAEINLLPH